jgi:hypothetical protein
MIRVTISKGEGGRVEESVQIKKAFERSFVISVIGRPCYSGERTDLRQPGAFAATDDLKSFLFATAHATRKYPNITEDPRIAMVSMVERIKGPIFKELLPSGQLALWKK